MAKSINLKAKFSADTTDIKKGAKESQEAIKEFKSQGGDAIDQFAGLFGTSMGQVSSIAKTFQGGMLTMSNSIKATATGTGVLSKAMGILKIALAATGIGLLVVALGSLVAYFKKSQDGADKLGQIMAPLKILFAIITDTAAALGRMIVKAFENPKQAVKDLWEAIKTNIVNRVKGLVDMFGSLGKVVSSAFKFDWDGVKEASKEVGSAWIQTMTGLDEAQRASIGKYIDGVKDRMKSAKDYEKMQQQLEKDKIAFIVEEANLQAKIAELREKASDVETYNAEQRLAANTEAIRLTELLGNKRIALATRERDINQAIDDLAENMNVDYEKAAQLSAEILRIKAETSNEIRGMNKRQKSLTEEVAKERAETERIAKLRGMILPEIKTNITTSATTIKAPMIDTKDALTKYRTVIKEMKTAATDLSNMLSDAMAGIVETFAEGFGDLLAGESDFRGFARLIAGTFADLAINVGRIAIGIGVAGLGIKAALESLNPFAAIAAGVALVGLGTAAKSSLKSAASGSAGTFSNNSGGSSNYLDVRRSSSQSEYETKTINVKLSGELKAQGNQLVAVIKNETIRKGLVS